VHPDPSAVDIRTIEPAPSGVPERALPEVPDAGIRGIYYEFLEPAQA
jgi:hypothetical protein